MFFWICFILSFLPLFLLFPVKKIGKKNLKSLKGENFIISCNHMSNMDPVMLDISLKRKLRYLAKIELFKKKFTSAVLKSYGGIPVDRGTNDTRAIRDVFKVLNNDKNLCIFPQGKRMPTPEIDSNTAKDGVAMFAIRTNTPVVPMMFDRKIKIFRRTKLLIGQPLYPDEARKKDKDYIVEFADKITDAMAKLLEGDKK